MDNLLSHLITAFALIFVIEGLLYAIFPSHVQKAMEFASMMPQDTFRYLGGAMVAFGILMVWIFQTF